ncbi:MAG: porin family protein [Prevotella sp.]|nr:porin family protein [Prevotella sp.]MBR6192187.1 porin family protein [Prevotella sp.]
MKRLYTTLVVAAALLMTISAQAQVKFGVRAGANLVNMKLSGNFVNNLNKDNRAGFYLGPTVKFSVPIVGLSMDASLLYDQRSTMVTEEIEGTVKEESMITRQLAIPLNVRYGWGLGSVANVFLFAGPQVAFNFAKDKKSIFNSAADWSWKQSNFSVNVGLGCTILSHVELKANYNIACGKTGEATVWNAAKTAALGTVKSKYNSWQLGMAYYF